MQMSSKAVFSPKWTLPFIGFDANTERERSLLGLSRESLQQTRIAGKHPPKHRLSSGRLNLTAQGKLSKDISAMKARRTWTYRAYNDAPNQSNPVNGIVDVDDDGAKQEASFGRSQLRVPTRNLA